MTHTKKPIKPYDPNSDEGQAVAANLTRALDTVTAAIARRRAGAPDLDNAEPVAVEAA